MKIYKLEKERVVLGRKPKVPRMDQQMISKIGQGMYHCDGVKEVEMRIKFKNGTTLVYQRGEEEDEIEELRKNRLEGKGGHC